MQSMLLPILMFALLGAMMFFGMRKQKRQVAESQKMQERLIPGARIMTTSGLHGTVTAVADDTIELEIAPGLRTTWVRAAVREVVVAGPTADTDGDPGRRPERTSRVRPEQQGRRLGCTHAPALRAGAHACAQAADRSSRPGRRCRSAEGGPHRVDARGVRV